MDQDKIKKVIDSFFESLKAPHDHKLETGLNQHMTIDILKKATSEAVDNHPEKFEEYVKWFLNASMYLLDEDNELMKI